MNRAMDVLALAIPVPGPGCWLWLGPTANGYGVFNDQGRRVRAHRAAYEQANGPIPDGMVICHKCDTPSCVNPDHLFCGTQRDNVRDMAVKGRHRESQKAMCPAGHSLVPENLTKRDDRRECLTCKRDRDRMGARKRRAALAKFA